MIALVVALAAIAGCAVGYSLLITGHWKREARGYQRREQAYLTRIDDLVNRTMYMAEKPWSLPPTPPAVDEYRIDPDFVFHPEQSVIEEP